jgi:subtilisin family serine protease
MDPALQELIAEGKPDDEVAVIVRLMPGAHPPPGLRLVARFGEIATARTVRRRIAELHRNPAIASIKAPRLYSAELEEVFDGEAIEILPTDQRRPSGLTETGRGVTIAVLDWGCDLTHDDLRHENGKSRITALWDQRGDGTVNRYGYGQIHESRAIDAALATPDAFGALGYHFAASAQHGTHVLGIAAGNGRGGGPQGIAPEADIIFCHLGSSDRDLGNSIELLEALDFAVNQAGDSPLVVNMSVGRHAGPHDSSLLVEKAIDWILTNRPGTVFAQSAGNYYNSRCHMSGRLHETMQIDLPIQIGSRSSDNVVVETWYPAADEFDVVLEGPGGIYARAPRGGKMPVTLTNGTQAGMLYHRAFDPNNGDHLIDLVLRPEAPAGDWRLRLTGLDVVDGRWHSWIERDTANPSAQARFREGAADRYSTTGSICNALRTIAVGAHDAHADHHDLGKFSSVGPTRDGRVKPLLTAPGVRTLSCRSAGSNDPVPYIRMSGTSMASPHVAGALALMLQAGGKQSVATIRRILFANLAASDLSDPRNGYGRLEISRAVEAARPVPHRPQHESTAETETAPDPKGDPTMASDTLASPWFPGHAGGEILVERALDPGDANVRLIGWGGRRLAEGLERGDIVVNRNGDMMAMAAGSQLFGLREAAEAGLVTEGPWPGRYVQLLTPDGQPSPFARRIMAPDGLLLPDLVIARPVLAESTVFQESTEFAEATETESRPMLRLAARGSAVVEAQTKLNAAHGNFAATGPGLANCPLDVDGVFGRLMQAAVLSFQRRVFPGQPNDWDGVVGPRTWAMLDEHRGVSGDRPPIIPTIPPNGYVPPNIITPVSLATVTVPVIVLPGVMGTRLSFPTSTMRLLGRNRQMPNWDPNSNGEMAKWFIPTGDEKVAALGFRTRADIMRATGDATGWSAISDHHYRILLEALQRDLATGASPCAGTPGFNPTHSPIYAFGYDWRQSCSSHAGRLDGFIDNVLERERARQVILVTHSMGGLVARSALPLIHSKVMGIVHCVQPAVGAVAAVRRCITGFEPSIDRQLGEFFNEMARRGEAVPTEWQSGQIPEFSGSKEPSEAGRVETMLMTAIFSDNLRTANPQYYCRLMSVLPGAMQLLPSNAASAAEPTWLRPHVPSTDIYDAYKFLPYGSGGGIVHPGLSAADRAEFLTRVDDAKTFHATIGYHAVTGVVSGSGKKTDTAFDPATSPMAVITRAGDGTVPDFSARCPDLARPIFRVSVADVVHGDCFHKATFLQTVISGVDHILRGKAPLRGGSMPDRSSCMITA